MTEKKKPSPMRLSILRMALSSFRFSWRISVSVAAGVGIATAVMVGALLVGDSMRGSLHDLTLQRLGKTQSVLYPGQFFDFEGLVDDGVHHVPVIFFDKGVLEYKRPDDSIQRSGRVQIVGCDNGFWLLDEFLNDEFFELNDDEIILNQSAADELGVVVGDLVTVRLPIEQAVPADSPLGRKEANTEGLPRLKVVKVLEDRGLARFSLTASQATPLNAFLSRRMIAESLDREGQANMLLFDKIVSDEILNVNLAALGMKLSSVAGQWLNEESKTEKAFQYQSLSSNSLLLPDPVVDRVLQRYKEKGVTPQSTYLANSIERTNSDDTARPGIPYSTITAVDSTVGMPLDYRLDSQRLPTDNIPVVLNQWAADQLNASEGTELEVFYYEPEVEGGEEIERSFSAIVSSIVPLTEPDQPHRRSRPAIFKTPPTRYNDPDLTPVVPGVTDQDSISDWDLPFKLTRKISREDDDYWKNHRLTPKLFLPLDVGRAFFGSRFGVITSIRFPETTPVTEEDLCEVIRPVFQEIGWSITAIRSEQLAASKGTTPFDGLFFALSFFVIAAAVLLIAMLFRLGLIQRMRQYGVLLVTGWSPSDLMRYIFAEGIITAVLGLMIGMVFGVVYAMAVLYALRTWWVGAVTVPFLEFHWSVRSLLIGGFLGLLIAAVTVWMSSRWLMKTRAQNLLSGRNPDAATNQTIRTRSLLRFAVLTLFLISCGLGFFGALSGGQIAAGAFVGSGMSILTASLAAYYLFLSRAPNAKNLEVSFDCHSISRLAVKNMTRYPTRSTMTVGLIASASFLIFAIAAFQLQPSDEGTGGFRLIGESSQPVFEDLSVPAIRAKLMGPDASSLDQTVFEAFRLKVGQDASCNNLYQATRPTVLGIPDSFSGLMRESDMTGFRWAAGVNGSRSYSNWDALQVDANGTADDPIPIILDQNTAMWSLQMMKGVGERKTFEYEAESPIVFEVVGLLSNSLLQGKVMMSEANFERIFPKVNGYQFYLIGCEPSNSENIRSAMESRFSDIGMDLSDASTVLARMMAVQNTYLRTFQSLGALGLLLGTFGLGVAQIRSVLERQSELAILRSLGFSIKRLGLVVFQETMLLLMFGVGFGFISAVLAVLPHAFFAEIDPPLFEPIVLSILIILVGVFTALYTVKRVSTMPLLESLRSEVN